MAMYLPGHFEPDLSPATGSPARRPWSPIYYDDVADSRGIHDLLARGGAGHAQQRSEDSVEALDLADYARTLRKPTPDRRSAYPPFPHTSHVHPLSVPTPVHAGPGINPQYPEYPPSPDADRPFSPSSRDTFANAPPSLVSGTTHDSHDSYNRRPYSLPPFFTERPQVRGPAIRSPPASANVLSPRLASPVIEEDISRFPAFTRGWYDDPVKLSNNSRHSSLPPYPSERRYDPGDPYPPFHSAPSAQSRDILPWDSQRSDTDGPAVDASIKEERIRMLEREFGGAKGNGGNAASDEPVIGSIDEKGALITVGPKKRAGARWAQGILAFGAVVSSLYGALFIKPKPPAPPASKAPAFALYVLSILTFALVIYLFAVRPCCCGRRRKTGPAGPTVGGMVVLPVQGLPGGKKKKKNGKKGKNGKHGGGEGGGDVQVNLIVDPAMFERGREEEANGSEDEYGSRASAPRRPQRRSIFQGLEMERDWMAARTFVKRMIFVDLACLVLWAGVFVLILLGKKCPPGAFNGWCDSYNIGTAAACLLSFAYGFSFFFGIVDLHMSKTSPRTRT